MTGSAAVSECLNAGYVLSVGFPFSSAAMPEAPCRRRKTETNSKLQNIFGYFMLK
jgi:hypothetical protein